MFSVLCSDDFAYWQGLATWWESDKILVNLEHDLEASDEHIEGLLDCPHPLCTQAYECHWASTGGRDLYAVGDGSRETQVSYHHGQEEWAEWSAIGLVKITAEARVGPLEKAHWSRVEVSVENAVKRPWHVHWDPPLKHHHW